MYQFPCMVLCLYDRHVSAILALDIGHRRTGIAIADDRVGIVLPLETLRHDSVEQLNAGLAVLIEQRGIEHVVVGLPLLPSGKEGQQAAYVRDVLAHLSLSVPVSLIDERHTSQRSAPQSDPDAQAACTILTLYFYAQRSVLPNYPVDLPPSYFVNQGENGTPSTGDTGGSTQPEDQTN